MEPMSKTVANVLFWLVILLFMPSILAAYDLRGLLEPVQAMLAKLLDMVPNVFGAAVIGFVGWLVAKVLRGLVTNLLARRRRRQDGRPDRARRHGEALAPGRHDRLHLRVRPVADRRARRAADRRDLAARRPTCSERFLAAVPNIVAAALILVVTWYVAKFASDAALAAAREPGRSTRCRRSSGFDGAFAAR